MGVISPPLLLLFLTGSLAVNITKQWDPMIATTCTPSHLLQHTHQNQWIPTANTSSCIPEKLDILKQCQRLYPSLDITNIVESNSIKPSKVCKTMETCIEEEADWVVYRCLIAPFQSEALLVPSPCVFDHIHNTSACYDSHEWNTTAYNSCSKRNYKLKSFAVLLPCGVGLFTGVEFVCCPQESQQKINQEKLEYDDDEEDDNEDEDDDDGDYYYDATSSTTTTTTTTTEPPILDSYLQHKFDPLQEHANFRQAEQRLENLHRMRMSRVMHDWEELERKYQQLHNTDASKAEEFKKTVTTRFQKTIKNLEEEGLAEKRQLLAVHQQRVLQHLSTRKKESMECFTSALANNDNKVKKCLEKLMRILHKDRHHTLMHFRHLQRVEPGQATLEQSYTLQRLEGISLMAREALNMLERHPNLSEKLRPLIEDYVLSMQGRDDGQESLLSATRESDRILLKISTTTTAAPSTVESSTTSTTTEESEPLIINEDIDDVVNNIKREQIITIHRESFNHHHNYPTSTLYFTVGFAVITITSAVLIGLCVLVKRRVAVGRLRREGFLEINQQSTLHNQTLKSPEEKHVANLMINGYVNPTYSLLNGN